MARIRTPFAFRILIAAALVGAGLLVWKICPEPRNYRHPHDFGAEAAHYLVP